MNNYAAIVISILLTVIIGTTVFMGGNGTVEGTMKSTINNVNTKISEIAD